MKKLLFCCIRGKYCIKQKHDSRSYYTYVRLSIKIQKMISPKLTVVVVVYIPNLYSV